MSKTPIRETLYKRSSTLTFRRILAYLLILLFAIEIGINNQNVSAGEPNTYYFNTHDFFSIQTDKDILSSGDAVEISVYCKDIDMSYFQGCISYDNSCFNDVASSDFVFPEGSGWKCSCRSPFTSFVLHNTKQQEYYDKSLFFKLRLTCKDAKENMKITFSKIDAFYYLGGTFMRDCFSGNLSTVLNYNEETYVPSPEDTQETNNFTVEWNEGENKSEDGYNALPYKGFSCSGMDNFVVGTTTKLNKKSSIPSASVKEWTTLKGGKVVSLNDLGVNPSKDTYLFICGIKNNGTYTTPKCYKIKKHPIGKYVSTAIPSSNAFNDELYEVQIREKSKTGKIVKSFAEEIPNYTTKTKDTCIAGAKATNILTSEKVSFRGEEISVYDGGESISKSVKYKLKARSAAPAANINYITGKYTIPAKCEYKFMYSTGERVASTEWTGSATAAKIKGKDLTYQNGVLVVRRAATDKTVSSRLKIIDFSTKDANLNKISCSYDAKAKKLTIKNNSDDLILYAVSSAEQSPTKKLASKRSITINNADNKLLYVRVAGDKNSCKLPSKTITIDYLKESQITDEN